MDSPRRIAITLAAVIALTACGESEKTLPAADSPTISKTPIAETATGSPAVPELSAEDETPDSPPADISVEIGGICKIESIGDLRGTKLDVPVQVESNFFVSGWRAYQAVDGNEAQAWLRALDQNGDVAFQTPLVALENRPDVAKAVNRESALQSGFRKIEVSGLEPGSYTLEVALNAGPRWVRCLHTRQVQVQ